MKFIFTLLLIIPLACSNNKSEGTLNALVDGYEADIEAPIKMETGAVSNQKLMKTSFLSYETQDMDKSYDMLVSVISKYNVYIQDDSQYKSYNRLTRTFIIRLPSEHFQSAIDGISKHVDFFDTKRISSKDVTEEFIDLEARLKAKTTLENRYLELLSKAKTVKDVLEIERELSKIREEIEAKEGRIKYLKNKVSLSTLNVEFYKTTTKTGVTTSYGSKMWSAISSGFDGLSVFFLGLLHIWPLILIFTLVFIIIKRRFFNKKKS